MVYGVHMAGKIGKLSENIKESRRKYANEPPKVDYCLFPGVDYGDRRKYQRWDIVFYFNIVF